MTEPNKETRLPEARDLEYYLALNYPTEIVEDDGRFVVSIPDLPGCISYGDTAEEALNNIKSTKRLWLKGAVDLGQAIAEPTTVDDFSGKFVLRIPRSLHQSLDREARQQGVSLNMYISHLLSERHKLTALETLAEQWAVMWTTTPKVTFLHHNLCDVRQWHYQRVAGSCEWHFTAEVPHRETPGVFKVAIADMLDYLPKPPKVYRRVVKQRRLEEAYQSL